MWRYSPSSARTTGRSWRIAVAATFVAAAWALHRRSALLGAPDWHGRRRCGGRGGDRLPGRTVGECDGSECDERKRECEKRGRRRRSPQPARQRAPSFRSRGQARCSVPTPAPSTKDLRKNEVSRSQLDGCSYTAEDGPRLTYLDLGTGFGRRQGRVREALPPANLGARSFDPQIGKVCGGRHGHGTDGRRSGQRAERCAVGASDCDRQGRRPCEAGGDLGRAGPRLDRTERSGLWGRHHVT